MTKISIILAIIAALTEAAAKKSPHSRAIEDEIVDVPKVKSHHTHK